jgi:O-antigen/teichoic acid export membrane protein
MIKNLKEPLYRLLRWSEKYTKTDMVYFASGNFWINASRFISIGSGILLTITFTRLLTPEQFGAYKYVLAAAGLVGTFSLNGLGVAVMKAVAQGKSNVIPAIFRAGMIWTIPASLAALGISVYYFANGNSELGFAFMFIGLTNSVSNGIATTKNVWGAAGQFKMGTIFGIPKIFVPFVIILLTILVTKNVTWILFAYFFSNLALSFAGYFFIKWWFKIKASNDGVEETLRYGKQISALGFFQIASGQIDQLLLWHFAPPAALAIYALALAPVNEAKNLILNVSGIMFPKIAAKTEKEVHATMPLRIRQIIIASAVLTMLYITVVPLLFTYVFPKYLASILVSQVISLTLLFQVSNIIDTYLVSHGEIKKRTKIILTSQAIEFVLFLILIPFFGLWGAVAATVLSEFGNFIVFLWMYYNIRKKFYKTSNL